MSEKFSINHMRSVLSDLLELVKSSAARETELVDTHRRETELADRTDRDQRDEIEQQFKTLNEAASKVYRKTREQLEAEYISNKRKADRTEEVEHATIQEKAQHSDTTARKRWEEAVWVAETVFESGQETPLKQFRETCKVLDARMKELQGIHEQAVGLLQGYRQPIPTIPTIPTIPEVQAGPPPDTQDDPKTLVEDSAASAREAMRRLNGLWIGKYFLRETAPFFFVVLIVAAAAVAIGAPEKFTNVANIGAAAAGGLVISLGLLTWMYVSTRKTSHAVYRALAQALEHAQCGRDLCVKDAEKTRDDDIAALATTRDADIETARVEYEPILGEVVTRQKHHLTRITERYQQIREDFDAEYERDRKAADEKYEKATADAEEQFSSATREVEQIHKHETQQRESQYSKDWHELETTWKQATAEAYDEFNALNRQTVEIFQPWEAESWKDWEPPHGFASAAPFGTLHVDVAEQAGALPQDSRLALPGPAQFDLPAMLAFPNMCSLLIQSGDDGGEEAIDTLQTIMMRLMTTQPPGKVRFVIIDPVGLGQNFAGFMHLADYDDAYVGGKIWTDTRHIEQRLTDLTEHMENVIQKYLRNEFETIAEYNARANEIAEPYRFLVICNFPTNFTDNSSKRLASIISSGARCGVYALIHHDKRTKPPRGIQLADLEKQTVHVVHENGKFVWKEGVFSQLPLTLERPPVESFCTERLHAVGSAALDSSRVEVPFEVVSPDGDLWVSDSTADIRVPLGRAGATKLQYLALGHGTNQHALIAGKTGSGKSTFMHVLITNIALWYEPDEVQLYLVDFKKGVEFKTYATHQLPHARAVAIESDREFGLSVLKRLDQELKDRGAKFRKHGAQDIGQYRRGANGEPMPRIMLIIDEFQEFFVEDDAIAQDSALLLDRLVRQGRAFGMHVLLGSQTLGGAYSLARSTLGQMGVRIALQCSETDSYLILSDENSAARLLTRPGEAIYNDANGQVQGNSPFQVVWLPEQVREDSLAQIRTLAKKRGYKPVEPMIVFEGSVPADASRNHLLTEHLEAPEFASVSPPSAWLGDAVAIKGPTAATFKRQAASNLIIVGQRAESAMAILGVSMIALAAQHAPDEAAFYLFDATPPDDPQADQLARIASNLPHDVRIVSWRDVDSTMAEIHAELERRRDANETDANPVFMFLHGLQRYRKLRRSETDFGFSMSDDDKPPSPDKQFAELIEDGAVYGMHTLTWCDTVTNVERSFDRQAIRSFENRVLFQMSAVDSTTLIDSAAASKLGIHRALFSNEEHGTLEKFRPYALPSEDWLESVQTRLGLKISPGRAAKR